jgi:hypothetical protein
LIFYIFKIKQVMEVDVKKSKIKYLGTDEISAKKPHGVFKWRKGLIWLTNNGHSLREIPITTYLVPGQDRRGLRFVKCTKDFPPRLLAL